MKILNIKKKDFRSWLETTQPEINSHYSARNCPLAMYLRRKYPNYSSSIMVGPGTCVVDVHYNLPDWAREFVKAFDNEIDASWVAEAEIISVDEIIKILDGVK